MSRDRLERVLQDAHAKLLDAFDALLQGILEREGPAMEAKLRTEGMTPAEAAQGAHEHVERVKAKGAVERAQLEAQALTRLQ